MAKIIPTNLLEKALKAIEPGKTAQDVIFFAGKALRLKILYDREARGFNKADVLGPRDAFETSGKSQYELGKKERTDMLETYKGTRLQLEKPPIDTYTSETYKRKQSQEYKRDVVSITDQDFRDDDKAKRGYKKLELPFVPREISYEPQSKFVGIATMGRNNPFYQYTGSEDTIKFDINWYAMSTKDADRRIVINSCRWLEALTKADAYTGAPHRVTLDWGNKSMFKDDYWIVVDAPYTLTEFVDTYQLEGIKTKVGLLPQHAIQSVTMKRVTSENRTTENIIGHLRNDRTS